MTISSSGIPAYLDINDKHKLIRVCYPDTGILWKLMSQKQVIALADRDCVFGKGSASRLRYVTLQVSTEQAQMAIDDADLHEDRLHSSNASSTIIRERITAVRDGRTGGFMVFTPNFERCFAWPNYAHVS